MKNSTKLGRQHRTEAYENPTWFRTTVVQNIGELEIPECLHYNNLLSKSYLCAKSCVSHVFFSIISSLWGLPFIARPPTIISSIILFFVNYSVAERNVCGWKNGLNLWKLTSCAGIIAKHKSRPPNYFCFHEKKIKPSFKCCKNSLKLKLGNFFVTKKLWETPHHLGCILVVSIKVFN